MQFTRENAEMVMAGRKTQTRRPVKAWWTVNDRDWHQLPGYGQRGSLDAVIDCTVSIFPTEKHRIKWQVGKDYAVQPGRGKHAIGRMCITNIRQERAGDISEADAIAEGFDGVQGFIDIWTALYGKWTPEQAVWVLDFELVNGSEG